VQPGGDGRAGDEGAPPVDERHEQQVPGRGRERPDDAEQDPLANTWPCGEMNCGRRETAKTPAFGLPMFVARPLR
jgi:hypothetical protein